MGFYPVTDAFESCRGSYPAMGKEEFFCPIMGYRFNPWREWSQVGPRQPVEMVREFIKRSPK